MWASEIMLNSENVRECQVMREWESGTRESRRNETFEKVNERERMCNCERVLEWKNLK